MRSTNSIIIAVQECEPCTEQELRLCIMSLKARLYFAEKAADDMAEAIDNGQAKAKLRAGFWKNDAESRFKSIKMPVDKYLGLGNTPGTPEYADRLRLSKAILKKVMGLEL